MNREQLEAKAKELGIEFDENTSDEDLNKLIAEKEKTNDKGKDSLDFWKDEAKNAFEARDKAKNDLKNLKSKLSEMEEKIKSYKPSEEVDELKKELSKLRKFKEEKEEELRKQEEEKLSEIEKLQLRLKKEEESKSTAVQEAIDELKKQYEAKMSEYTQQLDGFQKQVKTLRTTTLESEVLKSASKHNAISPQTVFRIVKEDFVYDDDMNRWVKWEKDSKGNTKTYKEVDEYVKEFLSSEENDFLVKGEINPNSLGSRNQTTNTPTHTGKYNPNDPDLKRKAESEGLDVKDYISILETRDAKMKKVEENRKAI